MTEPSMNGNGPQEPEVPQPNALGIYDNPPGQIGIQPSPWSFDIAGINIQGNPALLLAISMNTGRTIVTMPPEFARQLAAQLLNMSDLADQQNGGIVTPPPPRIILPGQN